MNYKEHITLGVAFTLPIILLLHFFTTLNLDITFINVISLLLILFLGPLIMDLDHHMGKLREVTTFIGLIISIIGIVGYYLNILTPKLMMIGIILSSLGFMLCYVTKHRGITHTLVFSILFSLIIHIILLNIFLTVIAFISVYSHLIGDDIYFKII